MNSHPFVEKETLLVPGCSLCKFFSSISFFKWLFLKGNESSLRGRIGRDLGQLLQQPITGRQNVCLSGPLDVKPQAHLHQSAAEIVQLSENGLESLTSSSRDIISFPESTSPELLQGMHSLQIGCQKQMGNVVNFVTFLLKFFSGNKETAYIVQIQKMRLFGLERIYRGIFEFKLRSLIFNSKLCCLVNTISD